MMHRRWEGWGRGLFASVSSLGFLLVLSPGPVTAQPFGIASRTANSTLLIDSPPDETPPAMTPQRVFSPLTFNNPLNMVEGYDGTNRLYVAEKGGRIVVFDKDNVAAGKTTILDISARVRDLGEMGLLGFALDPDYNTVGHPNYGHFYVNYIYGLDESNTPGPTRISRFVNPDPTTNTVGQVPESSETILLTYTQPFTNHNGGWIGFGPDGMLYIASGDGGSGGDPGNRAQNINELLGKMLRIDVKGPPDAGLNYRIPPDNPLVGVPSSRGEIWAYGLRNPWRASFDQLSGLLYCGDVGQIEFEEIDIILKGQNYGWRRMEGFNCYNPSTNCNGNPAGTYVDALGNPLTLPIQTYQHPGTQQGAVTGGYVYYGSAVPDLYGMYIYADYIDGRIWGLRYLGPGNVTNTLLHDASYNIPSFAQDSTGEVYILRTGGTAQIEVLRPSVAPPPPTGVVIPNQLSAVPGLFNAGKGIDQTNQGIVPYQPVAQLWSDGALKERFLALPGTTQMTYNPTVGWDMPNKTVIVKNFKLPLDDRDPEGTALRIETRVLFKDGANWHGFSYEWNPAGTEALLVATPGKTRAFTRINESGATYSYNWLYPSRSQCFVCHTTNENVVLGLNTAAINCELTYPASGVTDNQLRTLDHIAMFDAPLPDAPANLPRMEDPFGSAPVEARAKSYFAANCAMCHQPSGGAPGSMDVRWETAPGSMNAISAVPISGLGLTNPRILYPGRPERSTMVSRVESLSSIRMPPLASSKVDPQGTQLIRDYLAWLGTNQDSDDDAFGDQYELDNAFDPFSGIGAPTLGDVDGDGVYSVADVTHYHNALTGNIDALNEPTRGDLTGDGNVTTADPERVAQWLAGNVPVLR